MNFAALIIVQLILIWTFPKLSIACIPEPSNLDCPANLKNAQCYRLEVPLDHSYFTSSKRISISYAIFHPQKTQLWYEAAVVIIPGGPGVGLLHGTNGSALLQFANTFERPIIILDPRGTGNTTQLDCPQFQQASPPFGNYQIRTIKDCLLHIGPDVRFYSARAMANDLDLIRRAVGISKLDLYGLSYGTVVAQVFNVQYPERVRSLLLDSPLPIRDMDVLDKSHHTAYERIYKLIDASYSANKLKKVLRKLRKEPLVIDITSSNGPSKYKITPRSLYFLFRLTVPGFSKAIEEAATIGNLTSFKNLFQEVINIFTTFPVQPASVISRALAPTALCNDFIPILPWSPRIASRSYRRHRLRQALFSDRSVRNSYFPFRPLEALPMIPEWCTAFPFKQVWREGLPSKKRFSKDVKALVLFGDRDPITPLEDASKLDPALREKIVVVNGAGHVVEAHPCAAELIIEFLTTLSVKNSSKCI